MEKNVKVLVVNAEGTIEATLRSLNCDDVATVKSTKDAIKSLEKDKYDVTFVHTTEGKEIEGLPDICRANPAQYIVILTDKLSPEIVQNSIKLGASGILNQPYTSNKVRCELEKYELYSEDKRT